MLVCTSAGVSLLFLSLKPKLRVSRRAVPIWRACSREEGGTRMRRRGQPSTSKMQMYKPHVR